ncbi:MAG: primosomal protein N', partial [Chloroflexales bacterium]|nr:primosomal protein N' [Chloroflexales bacterium]
MSWRLEVAVPIPAHSALGDTLGYASAVPLAAGTLVRVPLGRREVLGVVMSASRHEEEGIGIDLKPIGGALEGLSPLDEAWRDLVAFAARYYQRALGEVALAALPPQLRELTAVQLARRRKRHAAAEPLAEPTDAMNLIALSAEQAGAL